MSGPRRKGNAGGQRVNFRGAPETKSVRDLDPALGAPNPTILKQRRVRELNALTSAPGSWFRVWMPYHLAEMDAERRLYLPVNRDYVPLGLTTREWVSYEDYPDRFVRLTRPPHEIEGIVTNDGLYLYDDSAESRADYFERLERLMRYARLPK